MSSGSGCPIFVLTDTPAVYGEELNHKESVPAFVNDVETLLQRLKNVPMAGLVLEMAKVMKAQPQERERLFNYANNFPVLRTRVNARHGFVQYLDPRDAFYDNLEAVAGKLSRNHKRIKVKLDCILSGEKDPSMAAPLNAIIGDISPGGCFINIDPPVHEQFIHLRVSALANKRPIYSSVRWTRTDGNPAFRGMGVMFIDFADDQMEELKAINPT